MKDARPQFVIIANFQHANRRHSYITFGATHFINSFSELLISINDMNRDLQKSGSLHPSITC